MSLALGLLYTALRQNRSPADLIKMGINEDDFQAETEKEVWKFYIQFYREHGQPPRIKTVESHTEVSFSQDYPDEPLSYWIDQVLQLRAGRLMGESLEVIHEHLKEGEVDKAQAELRLAYHKIMRARPADEISTLQDLGARVWYEYKRRKLQVGLSGVSTGFYGLDKVTDGAQPGDFWALVGRTSKGKTWFLIKMALAACLQGKSVLFATYEMSLEQVGQRLFSMAARVPSRSLKRGELTIQTEPLLKAATKQGKTFDKKTLFKETTPFHIVKGSFSAMVEDLYFLAQEIQPDIMFIDGAYFLRTRETPKNASRGDRVAFATRDIKAMAQALPIPVIGSYQFNRQVSRKFGELENIYLSDEIAQLGSIVIGLEDEVRGEGAGTWSGVDAKLLRLLKGREGERGEFRIIYDMLGMKLEEDLEYQPPSRRKRGEMGRKEPETTVS